MLRTNFRKNYDILKNNSKLIYKTEEYDFEIYLTNDSQLTIINFREKQIWTIDKHEKLEKWEKMLKIFEKFGILIG